MKKVFGALVATILMFAGVSPALAFVQGQETYARFACRSASDLVQFADAVDHGISPADVARPMVLQNRCVVLPIPAKFTVVKKVGKVGDKLAIYAVKNVAGETWFALGDDDSRDS